MPFEEKHAKVTSISKLAYATLRSPLCQVSFGHNMTSSIITYLSKHFRRLNKILHCSLITQPTSHKTKVFLDHSASTATTSKLHTERNFV